MSDAAEPGTIRTRIPARLDRLPWSRFHWRIVIGLGTVWILDGLEVTVVGAIAARMTQSDSGIDVTSADIGTAAALYVTGACLGALLFGQLTDRLGRKKLFIATLGLYLVATVATAFATDAWYLFLFRFLTGAGIGGEYAAINSAIDELIPARNRGQVDLAINGSYWLGAAIGSLGTVVLLNTALLAPDLGWRLAFGIGGILGLAIMVVRRNVPESPRWLFIHGREKEAERIVDGIEAEVAAETRRPLRPPGESITVRQRRAISFREIARVTLARYPNRTVLGLALFVGQAFMYNAVTFDLGTILSGFFNVGSGTVPYFMAAFALGNLLGPLTLGRLFDTVGRKPMITATYLGSAVLIGLTAALLLIHALTATTFIVLVCLSFFVASAGASSAYLTVSEIFPMETRALAIALFYAVGTAVGGITGPALFGQFIHSGRTGLLALGFLIGAVAMVMGGVAELIFGVRAEQQSLENIARPLTAEEADREPAEQQALRRAERERDLSPEDRRRADERDLRVRERSSRNHDRETAGLRRLRPGPARSSSYSPGMIGNAGTASRWNAVSNQELDREIDDIAQTVEKRGTCSKDELAERVGARTWGPGRFSHALAQATREGRTRRLHRGVYRSGSGSDRERR
ncbi:MFS transporter [Actinomadura nitritigenes]|uniref:MFS transporter n=1 Tax=Actinomadura nitritigenes TaxID=134602 RepID=A0ABS3RC94_9ACTN|nr:MFS transporter [Actinomadura nitritigenes]MBO2443849.1 MFS transporter [Actinomadura nitritigenes]